MASYVQRSAYSQMASHPKGASLDREGKSADSDSESKVSVFNLNQVRAELDAPSIPRKSCFSPISGALSRVFTASNIFGASAGVLIAVSAFLVVPLLANPVGLALVGSACAFGIFALVLFGRKAQDKVGFIASAIFGAAVGTLGVLCAPVAIAVLIKAGVGYASLLGIQHAVYSLAVPTISIFASAWVLAAERKSGRADVELQDLDPNRCSRYVDESSSSLQPAPLNLPSFDEDSPLPLELLDMLSEGDDEEMEAPVLNSDSNQGGASISFLYQSVEPDA